ncbi:MAG: NAD(P)-dependent oxidoreductase [Candidatus Puniceispirillales bacterium]
MNADIVITEFLDSEAAGFLDQSFAVFRDDQLAFDPKRLRQQVKEARALIVRNRTQVDKALLDAAPKLSVIGRLGVGLDNIDTAACALRDIKVIPAHGANSDSVAEYAITAILVMMRPVWQVSQTMRDGGFPRQELGQGREIGGKTLGLIGFGGIGRNVAKRAAALGMTLAAYDPAFTPEPGLEVSPMPLADCLAASDAISLHMPLTDTTRSMINAETLAMMRPGAVLVNTARGGIVDHDALAASLRSGHLGGATLDVFENEPTTPASLAMFSDLSNIWLTPHIAGVTVEATQRVSWMTVKAVADHLNALN